MNEAAIADSRTPTQPAWTKRYQAGIAVLGAVLATTSYFGKDHAQAHWNDRASGIKAARANDDVVANTASLNQRIDGLRDDVSILTEDALAFEQHERPHAQSDRLDSQKAGSLSSRNHSASTILRKCQQRIASLAVLDDATDPMSPYREELKAMRQDVDKKLANTSRAEISYLIYLHPSIFLGASHLSATDQELQNKQLDELEKQTDAVEDRTAELATVVRDDAQKQRERYTRYADQTTVILSIVFVMGLLLSLLGKLSSGSE